jgi:hypothetical protein
MSGRYTPGPWRRFPVSNLIVARNAEGLLGRYICMLSQLPDSDDEYDANGRLIAAAPDMLAALEQMRRALDAAVRALPHDDESDAANVALYEQCEEAARAAEAAIAIARGEQAQDWE